VQKSPVVSGDTLRALLQLVAPFAPHLAEELWARLGETSSILYAPWPKFDPAKIASTETKLVFQINGRHRGDQLVPIGLTQDNAVELARKHPKVAPYLDGKVAKRVVYVPGKIINIIVEG
jgi:leucyl-tRNA synthetase